MLIPFTGGFAHGIKLDLGILFVPAVFFIVLGTDNGVNFTDGLDGLCTSVTILVATFLTIVSIGEDSGISPITGAVVGSLLGFLLFNVYPAKVFMGDTGSLLLGGVVSCSAIYLKMPLLILIIAAVPVLETLSVIIQVAYYKRTKKRIFKMTPPDVVKTALDFADDAAKPSVLDTLKKLAGSADADNLYDVIKSGENGDVL